MFFDAHCDTVTKIHAGEGDFAAEAPASGLHVSLPGLIKADVRVQVFALWAWRGAYGERTTEVAVSLAERLLTECRSRPDHLRLVRSARDLRAALGSKGVVSAIAAMEGADALDGDPDHLRGFFDRGIRLLTLAWADNEFCGTTFGGGGGLSDLGGALIETCEALGVVVDMSHASDQAFMQACKIMTRPFVASHSSCRAVCPNERNLPDQLIRALADKGGVMGINLGSSFLSSEFHAHSKVIRDRTFATIEAGTATFAATQQESAAAQATLARPPLALVVDHVRHAIDVGGEDCVGLGGDLDGVKSLPFGLDSVDDYPRIAELLLAGGLPSRQVEKVCFGNFARVFEELLPA